MELLIVILLFFTLVFLNNISSRLKRLEKRFPPAPEKGKPQETGITPPMLKQPVPSPAQSSVKKVKKSLFDERSAFVLKKILNWICSGSSDPDKHLAGEYAIATTWLIRIGVIVLICSGGFFLKYSIDHNWTTPVVRVISMSVFGLFLAVIATIKNKGKYRQLFIALSGAGFVMLYLSIMTAYKMYHLIPAVPAFILMAAVTVSSMSGALYSRSLLTALFGCIGGYLTPVVINTGSNNIAGLFLYMTILSAGTLIIAQFRNWILLNAASFAFYFLIGTAALTSRFPAADGSWIIIGLLALNFVIFGLQNVMAAHKRDMTLWEIFPAVGNLIYFLAAGYPIADKYYAAIKMPAMLSLFITAFSAFILFAVRNRSRTIPKNLIVFWEIALVFSLVLTVPFLTSDFMLVTAWSVMAYLLSHAAAKLKSKILMIMTVLLFTAIVLTELASDPCGFNQTIVPYCKAVYHRLLTAGVFIAALFGAGKKLQTLNNDVRIVMESVSGLLFFIYSSFEVFEFWLNFLRSFRHGGLSVYWGLLAVILLLTGLKKQKKILRICSMILFGITAFKIFFIDLANLEQIWRITAFAVIGVLMLTGAILYIRCKNLFLPEHSGDNPPSA